MARLHVRTGIDPDEPDVPAAVLIVDPEGGPGERALVRLGDYCHEANGWAYLLRTDGWAEHARDGGGLTVGVTVQPAALRAVGVDPAGFPGRSAVDPEAVVILRVRTADAPEPPLPLSEGTAVYVAGPDVAPDELLADYDGWPMVLMPPPEG